MVEKGRYGKIYNGKLYTPYGGDINSEGTWFKDIRTARARAKKLRRMGNRVRVEPEGFGAYLYFRAGTRG